MRWPVAGVRADVPSPPPSLEIQWVGELLVVLAVGSCPGVQEASRKRSWRSSLPKQMPIFRDARESVNMIVSYCYCNIIFFLVDAGIRGANNGRRFW
jgi:hypothetical protein